MKRHYRPKLDFLFRPQWVQIIKLARELGFAETLSRLGGKEGEVQRFEKTDDGESMRIESVSSQIQTLEDLLAFAEVDLEVYEVDTYTVNNWQQGVKVGNTHTTKDLYQVKAKIIRRVPSIIEQLDKIVDNIAAKIPMLPKPKRIESNKKKRYLLEPFITDLHIGKIAPDWTLNDSINFYDRIISDILGRVPVDEVERIVLPVGNDLLNVDSQRNQTFRGTPQMAGEHFEDVVTQTELMLLRVIQKLSEVAPVDVICIPGNHDKQSTFHIGRTIWAAFRGRDDITVKNNSYTRHYYQWNKVLLGFSHGDNVKEGDIAELVAAEVPQMWGNSVCREFHKGHLHQSISKKKIIQVNEEISAKGLIIRTCPTISPTDLWHHSKGYTGNVRKSMTFLFSPEALEEIYYFNL